MELWAILPELVLATTCLLLVAAAGLLRRRGRAAVAWSLVLVLPVVLVLTARMLPWPSVHAFDGTYVVDRTSTVMKLLVELGGFLTAILFLQYFREREQVAHAPVALAFATLGAMLVTSASDVALLLLFLETTAFASYVLVVQVRGNPLALEATVKYFLFGIFALAVMGYGFSFLYGLSGSLDLRRIGLVLARADRAWTLLAFLLVFVGFGFEVAFVPFHFWLPDALEGATAPVAGFVSVVPKIAAFAALLRFLASAHPAELLRWPWIVAGIATVTMTFANLAALRQRSLKRLLAYSSVAQAGYVLLAVASVARSTRAGAAMAYYLAAYLFMNLGAFVVVAWVERVSGTDRLDALRGLGRTAPLPAATLAVSLLSLAGIPPLGGFAGKVLLLQAALDGGMAWLAVTAAANWVIALSYYLRAIGPLYLERPPAGSSVPRGNGYLVVEAVTTVGTVVLGIVPGVVFRLLR